MRVYNFSAGPSMLPEEVLREAAAQITDYAGSGMSVMEMSHRTKVFEGIIGEAEALLRELMNIPENYKVLFVQGGASQQFAAVPLNLCASRRADYVITGNFASQAFKEGSRFTEARIAATSQPDNYTHIPELTREMFDPAADYVHITTNNTIFGTHYTGLPDTGEVPLVGDASSNIIGEPIDVSRFGVIYAGAQKNIAPAGVTIVIVREDLLNKRQAICPTMLSWQTQAEAGSLYNTPPSWSIYMALLVFRHVKALGGVPAMHKINLEKAALLYDYIDQSGYYVNNVAKEDRSIMNVPFVTPSKETDDLFVKEAAKMGLVTLKGHRLVGGMRASIYNAMPKEGIEALVAFMKDFKAKNA